MFLGILQKTSAQRGGIQYRWRQIFKLLYFRSNQICRKKLKIRVKKKITKKSRTGDHQWYITDNSKFKKHYPNWKQLYSTSKILNEIIDFEQKKKKKGM